MKRTVHCRINSEIARTSSMSSNNSMCRSCVGPAATSLPDTTGKMELDQKIKDQRVLIWPGMIWKAIVLVLMSSCDIVKCLEPNLTFASTPGSVLLTMHDTGSSTATSRAIPIGPINVARTAAKNLTKLSTGHSEMRLTVHGKWETRVPMSMQSLLWKLRKQCDLWTAISN